MKIQSQIPVSAFRAKDGFIKSYQKLIKDVVIPYQYKVLCDEAEDTEKSHVMKNFINAAKALKNRDTDDGFYGMVFQDSDAAKWLEAVAYSLALYPDVQLEKTADEFIDIIAAAQDENGYLNTYYTIKDKEKRWTNILEGHELYCSGHMIEAAVAYYEATGKDKLLRVMQKNAEHIYDVFIEKGHKGYPGHPEIELALMKMYRLTGDEKLFRLSRHFVDVRGVDPQYYEKERKARHWTVWNGDGKNHEYQQSMAPVRQQKDAVGHAVRAVYLYTAMADIASENEDKELFEACRTLWKSITQKRMYLTGAIGSSVHGEAFTVDYDLPSDTAYAETCASIGLMMFASRMLENEIDGEYADIMERAFYNTVLAGMQCDGKRFFYVNPLEVVPGISGESSTHRHALAQRPKWYACACCPPNVARLVSSFGKYAYGENETTAFCHMFSSGEVSFSNGIHLVCDTAYPYSMKVNYKVIKGGKVSIHIPSYSELYTLKINSEETQAKKVNGYVELCLSDGDEVELILDDSVKTVYPSRKIPSLTGMTALMRGPLVYCFEGKDNENDILSVSLKKGAEKTVELIDDDVLGKIPVIYARGIRYEEGDELYSCTPYKEKPVTLKAIPYFLWGNRGENQMRVFVDER